MWEPVAVRHQTKQLFTAKRRGSRPWLVECMPFPQGSVHLHPQLLSDRELPSTSAEPSLRAAASAALSPLPSTLAGLRPHIGTAPSFSAPSRSSSLTSSPRQHTRWSATCVTLLRQRRPRASTNTIFWPTEGHRVPSPGTCCGILA